MKTATKTKVVAYCHSCKWHSRKFNDYGDAGPVYEAREMHWFRTGHYGTYSVKIAKAL
jgi:hypothetical protein